ncbi:MAG: tRNA (adenosine(37)-N6)-dimethylallyltransferase MiaA [Betaproteobacteria bacterium]|nr:tRNA (adenosine(37)-N6)-dimethylallyltransferase MiaA [Betaproteobacteria bacterium]
MTAPVVRVILGPTASGKTALALALAQQLPVEIISVDSALVYRGMDIGTAKPSVAERSAVPHHLIDIVDPTGSYSAGQFVRDTLRLVDDITRRGRVPLLVGGTMLYLRALLVGLAELPQADATLRADIDAQFAERGVAAMHAELAQRDAVAAARIRPSDRQRIQRALELLALTGEPIEQLYAGQAAAPPLRASVLALVPGDRRRLHAAIDARFDAMVDAGLVDELRTLRQRHALNPAMPAMRCVGYRQAWAFLEGELDAASLRATGQAASRQLARRQLTWLRQLPIDRMLDPHQPQCVEQALQWALA